MVLRRRFLVLSLIVAAVTGAPGYAQDWSSFEVYVSTDYAPYRDPATGKSCSSYRFTIQSDGSYTANPCATLSSSERKGKLTTAEQKKLEPIADRVISENLPETIGCEDLGGIALGTKSVTVSADHADRIFLEYLGAGTNFSCSRGSKENLDELAGFFKEFMDHYLPEWSKIIT